MTKSIGSEGQDEIFCAASDGGGGVEGESVVGLGLPNIAESIEYSRFAASEPNENWGSKEVVSIASSCCNGSANKQT